MPLYPQSYSIWRFVQDWWDPSNISRVNGGTADSCKSCYKRAKSTSVLPTAWKFGQIIMVFFRPKKANTPFSWYGPNLLYFGRIFWSFGPNTLQRTWQHCTLCLQNMWMSSFYKSEALGFLPSITVYLSIGSCITAVSTYQFSLFF